MPEYLTVRRNGQITLPAQMLQKAKIKECDLLEAIVDPNGTIQLVPKPELDHSLADKYQNDDIEWAVKQKNWL